MITSSWTSLAFVALLIGINAVLAAAEMALVSLRPGQVRRLGEESAAGRQVARLIDDPNRYLSAVQLGITLAGFLASAAAAVSLSEPLATRLTMAGKWSEPLAIAAVTIVLSLVSLVFGELVPKRLAMQRAEQWSLALVAPISWLIIATRPIILFLSWLTDRVVQLAGGDPSRSHAAMTKKEMVDLVGSQPMLSATQQQIMAGAIEIADRPLRKVMVPRNQMVSIDASTPTNDALKRLLDAGHSRAPVVRRTADEPIGQVHIRDLIDPDGFADDRATVLPAFPETLSVLEALRGLQETRTEMAAVIDEHGGTAGIVTLEDLIEELVGEIYDETDQDLADVEHCDDGSLIVPGSFPIHDIGDLGMSFPSGEYDTVAGLILDQLGRLPEIGDRVQVSDVDLEVLSTGRRSVGRVRLTPRRIDPNEQVV